MSKNFAVGTVLTPPLPASSGTSLTLQSGHGARFVNGQASLVPSSGTPDPTTGEVVTISVSGDVVTLTRAQESTSARTVVAGDLLVQGVTAGMWDSLSTLASSASSAASSAAATASSASSAASAAQGTANAHASRHATGGADEVAISATQVTAGTLPLARGGTGGTDAATARTALGLGTAATQPISAFVQTVNGVGPDGAGNVNVAGGGGILLNPPITKTSAYAAVKGDSVLADGTSAGFTVTAPTSPAAGDVFAVKRINSGSNVITVIATGKTIDGDPNATLVVKNAGAVFKYDGSNWQIFANMTSTGSTGPAGPAGPAGLTGGSGVQPLMAAGTLGSWYLASGVPAGSLNNQTLTAGTLVLGTPFIAPEDMTIDAVGCYVQTGAAGANVRLGIYLTSAANPYRLALNSAYATLLVDAGTVSAATSSTRATITLGAPQVITKGTAVCVGVAAQNGAPGIYCEANSMLFHGPWGSTGDLLLNGPNIGVRATGVTGALPATFTPTAFAAAGIGGAGFFRRSA